MYVGDRLAPMFDPSPAARACKSIAKAAAVEGMEMTRLFTPRGGPRVPPSMPPLRDSYYLEPVKHIPPDLYQSGWATDKEYAPYQEHGWGLFHTVDVGGSWVPAPHTPYPIVPRKPGGVLHFFTKDGHEVFTKLVIHPGAEGFHMFARGANIVEATLPVIARAALEVWAREQSEQGAHQMPIVVWGKP